MLRWFLALWTLHRRMSRKLSCVEWLQCPLSLFNTCQAAAHTTKRWSGLPLMITTDWPFTAFCSLNTSYSCYEVEMHSLMNLFYFTNSFDFLCSSPLRRPFRVFIIHSRKNESLKAKWTKVIGATVVTVNQPSIPLPNTDYTLFQRLVLTLAARSLKNDRCGDAMGITQSGWVWGAYELCNM